MIIFPAIDLMAEGAVRLKQGDPTRRIAVGDDPVALACRWADEGARWLHVVDLDGAMAGVPRHLSVVERICRAVTIPVQVGGGLRTVSDVRAVYDAGAARAILGTAAFSGDLLAAAVDEFGDRIAVALDVRDGLVAVEGWQRTSALSALDAARQLAGAGVVRLIYTDVRRDGMLSGPNLVGLRSLISAVTVPVILSGGMTTTDDLRAAAATGAEGAIVGRAFYEGRLLLADALAAIQTGG